jgi:DNA-binding LacI/PurR family transcriptional regulator
LEIQTTNARTDFFELGKSLPLLLLDSRLDARASFVGTDNYQSIALLVDYLHRTGEPPCYFDMPNVNRNAVDRRRAYVLAMKKWGSEPKIVPAPTQSWAFEAVEPDGALAHVFRMRGLVEAAFEVAGVWAAPSDQLRGCLGALRCRRCAANQPPSGRPTFK